MLKIHKKNVFQQTYLKNVYKNTFTKENMSKIIKKKKNQIPSPIYFKNLVGIK